MKVERYNTLDVSLRAAWNPLLAASASDSIFLTWEWCEAWWKNYGAGRPLFILVARDGEQVLGIAPLFVDRVKRAGAKWNCLRVIGDGSQDSDYLDFIVPAGHEHPVVSAFVDYLIAHQGEWDWLQFEGTSEDSVCLSVLLELAKQKAWKFTSEPMPSASLRLPDSFEEYVKLLQPRVRSKVRSSLAFVDQTIGSAPKQCRDAAELDSWLPILFDLHARRWQQKNLPGVFRGAAKRSFYHDISRAALQQGWLAFHRLDWGECPLALQYGFRYRNRFYLLQEGYDPAFEPLRPGMALRGWLMRHWIEEKLEEYDFLAGASSYKLEWGAQRKYLRRVTITARAVPAWAAMQLPRFTENVKSGVRRAIPKMILDSRERLQERRAQQRWNQAQTFNPPALKRLVKWTASHAYTATPLGGAIRALAGRYSLPEGHKWPARRSLPSYHIFIYHRVNDERDPFFFAFSSAMFRAQMEHLAKRFRFVTLDQLASGDLPSNGDKYCAGVTFDDGYRDNFLFAYPILKELGIPATIFLATGYIGTGDIPWYDKVRLAFKLTACQRVSLSGLGGPDGPIGTQDQKLQVLARTLNWLRGLEEQARSHTLAELYRELRVPSSLTLPNTMLAWDDVRRMSKDGITFGAHTITHPVLAGLPKQQLEREILGSKKTVEDRLQLPVRHFAYPFGKHFDYGPVAKQVVQDAGFASAVTTVYGVNGPAEDRFELKRFCLREPDAGIFALKLDWYRLTDATFPVESPQGHREPTT